jgi:hypothetical protein
MRPSPRTHLSVDAPAEEEEAEELVAAAGGGDHAWEKHIRSARGKYLIIWSLIQLAIQPSA